MAEEIDWGAYATHYDLMCSYNPAYDKNLKDLLQYLDYSQAIQAGDAIADLGAGTGNFVVELAKNHPRTHFMHIDSNREMNSIALSKYRSLDLDNVSVIEEEVQALSLEPDSLAMVLCIHSLYAMAPQPIILQKIKRWLRPGGLLYVVDLGRRMRPIDWGLHMLQQAATAGRARKYLRDALSGREVARQNKLTQVAQDNGRYWTHTTDQFGSTLRNAGFSIEKLAPAYRGYSDLAICRAD